MRFSRWSLCVLSLWVVYVWEYVSHTQISACILRYTYVYRQVLACTELFSALRKRNQLELQIRMMMLFMSCSVCATLRSDFEYMFLAFHIVIGVCVTYFSLGRINRIRWLRSSSVSFRWRLSLGVTLCDSWCRAAIVYVERPMVICSHMRHLRILQGHNCVKHAMQMFHLSNYAEMSMWFWHARTMEKPTHNIWCYMIMQVCIGARRHVECPPLTPCGFIRNDNYWCSVSCPNRITDVGLLKCRMCGTNRNMQISAREITCNVWNV